MELQEERISVERSQRVYKLNNEADENLIVFHGHGQLAKFFIKKFEFLNNNFNIIAPEGMHRYYLDGYSGRVGATWMTKEDRLTDIDEQIAFLNKVLEKNNLNPEKTRLIAFSQGIATCARWIAAEKHLFKQLVFWAGNFPPEIELEQDSNYWENLDLHYVFGNQDEFFSETRVKALFESLDAKGFRMKTHIGDFKHEIEEEMLKEVLSLNK